MSRLLFFAYLLEAGLLLLVVPWSAFWERNLFIDGVPVLGTAMTNHFVRGAVSGFGILCLWAALSELAVLLAYGRARRAAAMSHDANANGASVHR